MPRRNFLPARHLHRHLRPLVLRRVALEQQPFERYSIYAETPGSPDNGPMTEFKRKTGNEGFRRSFVTWFNLVLLLVIYPAVSLAGMKEDPSVLLKSLTQGMLMFMLIVTVIFEWSIFGMNFLGVHMEKTGLKGVGLRRIRLLDFAWAIAFYLAANAILSLLASGLAKIGLPIPGDVGLLIPTTTGGKIFWVVVAATAGFCEEVAFRGYLMTRLRLTFNLKSWIIPVIIASLAFGSAHGYQGLGGMILICVYGLMFALLFIYTGRLWPCVIAHFLQDVLNLFLPH